MPPTPEPSPDLVADVGNSRLKWGRCGGGRVAEDASLPADDPAAWQAQLDAWGLAGPLSWAVAGVHPARRDALAAWLRRRGDRVRVLTNHRLPLRVLVDHPDRVGIDRLLNAVAANDRVRRRAARVVIDAGTAVTVNLVDEEGAFRGGAIFPGPRLMAEALHGGTALLPRVEVRSPRPPLPGTSTAAAIEAGVFWAMAGGTQALVRELRERASTKECEVFLTGGAAPLLAPVMEAGVVLWPRMTLEGIRLSAEALGEPG